MQQSLPYGVDDLNDAIEYDAERNRIRCVVRGCSHWLTPPTRKHGSGDVCPDHGIRVHKSGTWAYGDPSRNVIVDDRFLMEKIVNHPFKYESHRLGTERSEDMVTYNVMRSVQRAGLLHKIAQLVTGYEDESEPRLYLWGLEMQPDDVEPWSLLVEARERFESNLPVKRPLTEPDAALWLPGRYLILIEAKFTSPNGYYATGPRKNSQSLTLEELLTLYSDPALTTLDMEKAKQTDRVAHQLWRNMVLAEWMAKLDSEGTQPYVVNLVRAIHSRDDAAEFRQLIHEPCRDRFQRMTWEQLYTLFNQHRDRLDLLCRYLETKTERLKPAFTL